MPSHGNKRPHGRRANRNVIQFHKGHKVKVPNHPYEITSQPWFPLTVRVNNPTGILDFGGLYNAIVTQLSGLSIPGSVLSVRLMAVRVWGPIPTTNTPLVMRVYDLFDDIAGSTPVGNQIFDEITDYADQVNRARCGFVWSTAQQQKVLLATTGSNDKIVWLGGAGNGSVAYVTLLWRPAPQNAPPALGRRWAEEEASPFSEVRNNSLVCLCDVCVAGHSGGAT